MQQNNSGRYNTLAVVCLISACLGWSLLPVLGTLVSIITGHIARAEIRRTREEGDTLAVVGLVLSWAQVLMLVGSIVLVLVVFGGMAAFLAWLGWSSGMPPVGSGTV